MLSKTILKRCVRPITNIFFNYFDILMSKINFYYFTINKKT